MAKILCIHHNHLFRQCLAWVLMREERLGEKHLQVVALDHRESDLRAQITAEQPDVILLDLTLEETSGEWTRFCREQCDAHVVLLVTRTLESQHSQDVLLNCYAAGADGYVSEEDSLEELGEALVQVLDGHKYWSTPLRDSMMDRLVRLNREARWRRRSQQVDLTRREREILEWIAEGMSNKEVAKKLSLSLYTVKNHVHKIIGKLQATDRNDAVRKALESSSLSSIG